MNDKQNRMLDQRHASTKGSQPGKTAGAIGHVLPYRGVILQGPAVKPAMGWQGIKRGGK